MLVGMLMLLFVLLAMGFILRGGREEEEDRQNAWFFH